MTRMTRQQAVATLADGVRDDLAACAAIHLLLERQFEAAVRHQSAVLGELAQQLAPLLDAMEARRQQRLALVRALFGEQGSMAGFLASLDPAARAPLERQWRELEALVVQCQAATTRNSTLLADQFSVMQRVLHGAEDIYAPR
jgi:flagella synthesis protein FlgN